MTARILVGDLVRVARPEGGGPVNHEGHTGRVVDALGDGSAFLVAYDGNTLLERWVDALYLVSAEPSRVDALARAAGADYRLKADGTLIEYRAHVAEPEGHDDHLDAIEGRLIASGRVLITQRGAFVPKGGA